MSAVAEKESELGRPLTLRLSQIERFENQPRKHFDKQALKDLANSIQSEGQKNPVRVCEHPTKSGVFILIGGERRWRASHLIKEWTGTEPTLLALVNKSPDGFLEHFEEALYDNVLREGLTPLDEADSYKILFESGKSKADIAKRVGRSVTYIDNYIRMSALPPAIRALMNPNLPEEKRLSVTTAIDISKMRDLRLQESVALESLERSLGVVEVRTLIEVRARERGYGVGGSLRKPGDDYSQLKTFIGNVQRNAQRLADRLFIPDLYDTRDDPSGDRKRDAVSVRHAIRNLEQLLKEIEST